jgi:hypothetical protein
MCCAKLDAAARSNALVVERFSRLATSQAMPLLELTLDEVGARAPRADAAAAAGPEQERGCANQTLALPLPPPLRAQATVPFPPPPFEGVRFSHAFRFQKYTLAPIPWMRLHTLRTRLFPLNARLGWAKASHAWVQNQRPHAAAPAFFPNALY